MTAKTAKSVGAAVAALLLLASTGCAGLQDNAGLQNNAEPALPPAAAGQPAAPEAAPLKLNLDQLSAVRDADFSVAVLDNISGESWSYNPGGRYLEASLVKVPILLTLIREASEEHRSLTGEEEDLAVRMIEYSDNEATSELYALLGGRAALNRTYELIGVTDTEAGEMWGATETSAADQLRIVRTAACGADWLDGELLEFAVSLMRNVCAEQSWGITAGAAEAEVALKNGWLQDDDAAWNVGSAGFVQGAEKNYSIVVLSARNATLDEGIDVVEDVAALINGYRG